MPEAGCEEGFVVLSRPPLGCHGWPSRLPSPTRVEYRPKTHQPALLTPMLRRLSNLLPPLAIAVLLTPSSLWPHGGRLDQYGCHHNRIHSGYHCHRGVFKGSMFDSKAEMLQALQKSSRSPAESKQPSPTVILEFSGQVVGISGGDMITVLHKGEAERIPYSVDRDRMGLPTVIPIREESLCFCSRSSSRLFWTRS